MQALRRLDAAFGRVHELIGSLVGLTIAAFVVGISTDLFLRLFGLGNLPGVQEIIEYALFASVFLTAPWILRLGAHVRVDLLLSALPRGRMVRLEQAIDVICFAVCVLMAWFAWTNLANSRMFNAMQMKYFNVPEWWLLGVVVASFVLLAIEFVFRFFRASGVAEELADLNKGM